MKYDPIMCMMVDDSVKTEDEAFIIEAKKQGHPYKAIVNGEEKDLIKYYIHKGFTDIKLTKTTGKDSKTIDHAIRSCDINMYERIYQEAKAAVGGKYGFISNLSDLETAINDANRRGEKEDAKKLKAIYKKYN